MSLYLDSSIVVSIFTLDVLSARAEALIRQVTTPIVVSDFAEIEFSSAVAARFRAGDLSRSEALLAFVHFEAWAAARPARVSATPADHALGVTVLTG